MMMRKCFVAYLGFLSLVYGAYSQDGTFDFGPPVEIPMYLSGNFGEIRSSHFHAGIDIKTQGVIGHKILAIADGYVSRIKVQANGYGKALYIAHPNGYTSVYAHLDKFRDDIGQYVKSIQYEQETFEIDLYPNAGAFRVERGQTIALSGNSGGSSGPHLHFEIRDAKQRPLNVLRYPIKITDNVAPVFYSVFLYPFEGGQVDFQYEKIKKKTVKQNEIYGFSGGSIPVYGKFGIGAEIYDYLDGMPNRCGVYSIELKLDGDLMGQFVIERLDFSLLRYVNAHIDYEERQTNRTTVHRLYQLPNNQAGLYHYAQPGGYLEVKDTLEHDIEIVANDAYGNYSTLKFKVKGVHKRDIVEKKKISADAKEMPFDQENSYVLSDFKVKIPKGALYNDIAFNYKKSLPQGNMATTVHHIHTDTEPLHKYIDVSIKPDSHFGPYTDKLTLATVGRNNTLKYQGGAFSNGFVTARVREFGKYTIALDTLPPKIYALNLKNGGHLASNGQIKLIVKDSFSGIKEYRGLIDNKWALFEYDMKNDLMTFDMDEAYFERGQWHQLVFRATDHLNNQATYEIRFYW
jgi:hypothetical protein